MTVLEYFAPFVGALTLEVFYWYQLRTKLQAAKYKKLLRSRVYWLITFLAIVVGGASALIIFGEQLTAGGLLVAGAAMPTLLKKLIAVFVAQNSTKLGEDDAKLNPALEYFSVG